MPRIGPMIGETNIAATMKTKTPVVRPPAAMIEAPEEREREREIMMQHPEGEREILTDKVHPGIDIHLSIV
jgi:hypothetical protein